MANPFSQKNAPRTRPTQNTNNTKNTGQLNPWCPRPPRLARQQYRDKIKKKSHNKETLYAPICSTPVHTASSANRQHNIVTRQTAPPPYTKRLAEDHQTHNLARPSSTRARAPAPCRRTHKAQNSTKIKTSPGLSVLEHAHEPVTIRTHQRGQGAENLQHILL